MSTPAQLPEYWRRTTPKPRPVNWPRVGVVFALAMSSGALVFAGAMILGYGSTALGRWMMGAGVLFFLAAGSIGERP